MSVLLHLNVPWIGLTKKDAIGITRSSSVTHITLATVSGNTE
jgi:hypothetical protein